MIDTVYHVGHLAIDREKDPDLDSRASKMMANALDGKVTLYQRRVPEGFEYHCRAVRGA